MSDGRGTTPNRDDRHIGASTSSASEIFERWWAAYEAQAKVWCISRLTAKEIFFGGWDAGYDASSQIWKTLATRERQRGREAPHGEAAADAETVDA